MTFAGRHPCRAARDGGRSRSHRSNSPRRAVSPRTCFPDRRRPLPRVRRHAQRPRRLSWGSGCRRQRLCRLDMSASRAASRASATCPATVRLASLLPPRTARRAARSRRTSTPPDCRRCRSICGSACPATVACHRRGDAGFRRRHARPCRRDARERQAGRCDADDPRGRPWRAAGLLDIDGLSGTGTIEGAVPIRVDPGGAALQSGKLVGTVPGVMRYAGTGLPEPAPECAGDRPDPADARGTRRFPLHGPEP